MSDAHTNGSETADDSSEKGGGCGYRIGVLAFFGFVLVLVSALLRGLGS